MVSMRCLSLKSYAYSVTSKDVYSVSRIGREEVNYNKFNIVSYQKSQFKTSSLHFVNRCLSM